MTTTTANIADTTPTSRPDLSLTRLHLRRAGYPLTVVRRALVMD